MLYIPLFTNKRFQYLIYILGFYDTRLKVDQWSNYFNIEPIYALNVNGRILLKIIKILSFLIIRSICTGDMAIRRVDLKVQTEILLLVIIGGAIKRTPWTARMSWMLNPLSAITILPCSRWSRKPDFLTISLSLIDPL